MEHHFNVEFAKRYGIEEAIIVNNLYFWICKNTANEKYFKDGRVWTYNSNRAFMELFPYMNKTKIFRIIKKLEDEDIIIKATYNESCWDKTLWYSFSNYGIKVLIECGFTDIFRINNMLIQNDNIDVVKVNHRDSQSEPTIPYINNIYNKKEINKDKSLFTKKGFDFVLSLVSVGVDKDVVSDWIKIRNAKKASNTATAFASIKNALERINVKYGISPTNAIKICVINGWYGCRESYFEKIRIADYGLFEETVNDNSKSVKDNYWE